MRITKEKTFILYVTFTFTFILTTGLAKQIMKGLTPITPRKMKGMKMKGKWRDMRNEMRNENEGTWGMKMKGHEEWNEEWKWRENERTHPYDPQENEGHQFDEYPGLVVLHVEEHGMLVAKGVDGAEDKSGHQGRKEGAPERLQREVVGGLWGNALIIQHFWDTKRPASASKSVVTPSEDCSYYLLCYQLPDIEYFLIMVHINCYTK